MHSLFWGTKNIFPYLIRYETLGGSMFIACFGIDIYKFRVKNVRDLKCEEQKDFFYISVNRKFEVKFMSSVLSIVSKDTL